MPGPDRKYAFLSPNQNKIDTLNDSLCRFCCEEDEAPEHLVCEYSYKMFKAIWCIGT